MNKHLIAIAVIAAVATPWSQGAPGLMEIHQHISGGLRNTGRFLLPGPLFELIDSVPPGTTPHEKLLRLVSGEPPAAAPVAADDSGLMEFHEKVAGGFRTVGRAVLPQPLVEVIESVPPGATPHEKILRLAQGKPPAAAPEAEAAAIADWANNVASITTHRALDAIFPRGTPRKPVVIGSSDAKTRIAMEEDLNVMMRILEKAAGGKDESRPTAGGIELFSFSKSGTPRVFYLDGYGAMFVLSVKFPLLAPAKKDEQSRTNDDANSEWEKAREEVYGRPPQFEDLKFAPGEEFDAPRVEKLKQQIIDDLANAKNIRHLKPDDGVTVVVLGGSGRSSGTARRETSSSPGGRAGGAVAKTEWGSPNAEPGQATMSFRVKKSDIDAFAKGKLTGEEFNKKVAVQLN